jgi:hypothetical protein
VPVEKLDVVVQVLVEVATPDERPPDRPDGVDGQSDQEEDDRSEAPARELIERGESARRPVA